MPFLIVVALIICGVIYAKRGGASNLKQTVDFCFDCRKTNARLEQSIMTSCIWDGMDFAEALSYTQKQIYKEGFVPCVPPDAYGRRGPAWSVNRGNFDTFEPYRSQGDSHSGRSSFVRDIDSYDSKAVQTRRQSHKDRWKAMHPNGDIEYVEMTDGELYANFPETQRQLSWESMRCSQWGYADPVGTYFMHGFYGLCEVVGYDEPPLGKSLCYRVKVLSSGSVVGGIHFEDSTIKKIRVKR